jgi:hypothetical protein
MHEPWNLLLDEWRRKHRSAEAAYADLASAFTVGRQPKVGITRGSA